MRFSVIPLLVTSLCIVSAARAEQRDCPEQIGTDLVKLFTARYPDLKIPNLAELDKSYIDYNLKTEKYGCYITATGAFSKKNSQDVAFIAADKTGNRPQLIVAIRTAASWQFEKLPTFCRFVKTCYVQREAPGIYRRSQALDAPPAGKDEFSELSSSHDSIRSGVQESTGIVYVYTKNKWKYVWVSD